jgi:hypothetical protein
MFAQAVADCLYERAGGAFLLPLLFSILAENQAVCFYRNSTRYSVEFRLADTDITTGKVSAYNVAAGNR